MGILDKLFGAPEEPAPAEHPAHRFGGSRYSGNPAPTPALTDEQAIERYRYLLRTAPPETIEQAHEEAFAQLTPEQRRMVLQQLRDALPERERAAAEAAGPTPSNLAQMATRTELRQPGILERLFGSLGIGGGMVPMGMGPGPGMGGGFASGMAGGFLSSLAGSLVGNMIAQEFFHHSGYDDRFADNFTGSDIEDRRDQSDYGANQSLVDSGLAPDLSDDYRDTNVPADNSDTPDNFVDDSGSDDDSGADDSDTGSYDDNSF